MTEKCALEPVDDLLHRDIENQSEKYGEATACRRLQKIVQQHDNYRDGICNNKECILCRELYIVIEEHLGDCDRDYCRSAIQHVSR